MRRPTFCVSNHVRKLVQWKEKIIDYFHFDPVIFIYTAWKMAQESLKALDGILSVFIINMFDIK